MPKRKGKMGRMPKRKRENKYLKKSSFSKIVINTKHRSKKVRKSYLNYQVMYCSWFLGFFFFVFLFFYFPIIQLPNKYMESPHLRLAYF